MNATIVLPARRSGRPLRQQTAALRDRILDHATKLFFLHGYGATSMEAVANKLSITKRTLYARFANKAELFRAVVERVIEDLRRPAPSDLFSGGPVDRVLRRLAPEILRAAVSPTGLALHRLLIGEASRFPELAQLASRGNTREEVVQYIANALRSDPRGAGMTRAQAFFSAEQFMQLLVGVPQRRALGLGAPLTARELEFWPQNCVMLFMVGCFSSDAV